VGVLYIWPSQLLHTVYPFQGSGERRSVSFNATHTIVGDDIMEMMKEEMSSIEDKRKKQKS